VFNSFSTAGQIPLQYSSTALSPSLYVAKRTMSRTLANAWATISPMTPSGSDA
jgi:hypothetical protein